MGRLQYNQLFAKAKTSGFIHHASRGEQQEHCQSFGLFNVYAFLILTKTASL